MLEKKPSYTELIDALDISGIKKVYGNAENSRILQSRINLAIKHVRVNVSGVKNGVKFRFRPFRNNNAGNVGYNRLSDCGPVSRPHSNYELSS